MPRLRISSLTALALAAAALLGAPAAGAAGTTIHPETRTAFLFAKGSNGWRLQVTATPASGKSPIGVYAQGPHHGEVDYLGVKGIATKSGRIAGRVPGFGRIDVRFEQTAELPLTNSPQKGCKNDGKSALLKGYFRGTIEFHGEGGYTTVERAAAPGQIFVIGQEVCRPEKHRKPASKKRAEREGAGIDYLLAGKDRAGGDLGFSAFSIPFNLAGADTVTEYAATYTRKRHGLTVIASTRVHEENGDGFSLASQGGTPSEATVAPPAPFSGTGSFKLESPTTASWAGDLSVEIPTLGKVALAEPGFWAGACAGTHCTKTFPPGFRLAFLTSE